MVHESLQMAHTYTKGQLFCLQCQEKVLESSATICSQRANAAIRNQHHVLAVLSILHQSLRSLPSTLRLRFWLEISPWSQMRSRQ